MSFQRIAWLIALFASLASIYFIEIVGNPSATLCWFERMLMFGAFLVLTVGLINEDNTVYKYVTPFVLLGIPSALFQQLIHWNIIYIPPQPCGTSAICTTKFFELFGFITQATLCLTAFLVIAWCMWKLRIKVNKK